MIRKIIISLILILTTSMVIALWVDSYRLKFPLVYGKGCLIDTDLLFVCIAKEAEGAAEFTNAGLTINDLTTYEKYQQGSKFHIGTSNWNVECENNEGNFTITLATFTPTYKRGVDFSMFGYSYSSGTPRSFVWGAILPDGSSLTGYGFIRVAVIPIWAVVLLPTILVSHYFIRGPLRRYRHSKRGLCIHCGYDLTGNTSGVCPECGTQFKKSNLDMS